MQGTEVPESSRCVLRSRPPPFPPAPPLLQRPHSYTSHNPQGRHPLLRDRNSRRVATESQPAEEAGNSVVPATEVEFQGLRKGPGLLSCRG